MFKVFNLLMSEPSGNIVMFVNTRRGYLLNNCSCRAMAITPHMCTALPGGSHAIMTKAHLPAAGLGAADCVGACACQSVSCGAGRAVSREDAFTCNAWASARTFDSSSRDLLNSSCEAVNLSRVLVNSSRTLVKSPRSFSASELASSDPDLDFSSWERASESSADATKHFCRSASNCDLVASRSVPRLEVAIATALAHDASWASSLW
mmetsp:Transcript_29781/g.86405  ORF Transcript_29781/g.86405 Transcript_29781/m.86405 type:complete len:207 (-) Transcript_29781:613-1233(-)